MKGLTVPCWPMTHAWVRAMCIHPPSRWRFLRDAGAPGLIALASPYLREHELVEVTASPLTAPQLLVAIAATAWAVRPAIRRNLAANPRTPHAIAAPLVAQLADRDLARMAGGRGLRPQIAALAAETITRRGRFRLR